MNQTAERVMNAVSTMNDEQFAEYVKALKEAQEAEKKRQIENLILHAPGSMAPAIFRILNRVIQADARQ